MHIGLTVFVLETGKKLFSITYHFSKKTAIQYI